MPKAINLTSSCGTFNFLRPQLAKGSHKGKNVLEKIAKSETIVPLNVRSNT